MEMKMELTIDEVTELTVQIKLMEDGSFRVFAVRYDAKYKKWLELDVTEFIPLDEAVRLQAITQREKEQYFHQLGKEKKLWR
jgi:hypothetical protein